MLARFASRTVLMHVMVGPLYTNMCTGEGGTFCSGADLAVVAKDLGTAEAGQAMCTLMHVSILPCSLQG